LILPASAKMTTTLPTNSNDFDAAATLKYLIEALPGSIVAVYSSQNTINVIAYRQHTVELALFLKHHSALLADIALDCYVVDKLDSTWRFTVTYALNSSVGNFNFNIITKTTPILAVVSLQSVFPAFN
jgi:hypothetical protein